MRGQTTTKQESSQRFLLFAAVLFLTAILNYLNELQEIWHRRFSRGGGRRRENIPLTMIVATGYIQFSIVQGQFRDDAAPQVLASAPLSATINKIS